MEDHKSFTRLPPLSSCKTPWRPSTTSPENISPIDLGNMLMELWQTYVLQRCHDLPLTFEEMASHV